MAERKPPKRLFKNKEVVHTYQHDRENRAGLKHIVRDHIELLGEAESILLAYAEEYEDVDDRTLDEALGVLRRNPASVKDAERHVKAIWLLMNHIRASHKDVSDTVWLGILRTIQDEVRRNSSLNPGEKTYIKYASESHSD
jgi:hypothetical protein